MSPITNRCLPFIIIMIYAFIGCINQNSQISGNDLKEIFAESESHSAVSYWYAGKKEGYHFIQERWPVPSKTKMFKIVQNQIRISKEMVYTKNQAEWLNLKKGDVVFENN